MATERLRVFKGAAELTYSQIIIEKSDDTVVDATELEVQAESGLVANDVITIKDQTATTTFFTAKVLEIREETVWVVKLLTNGYELNNKRVQKVYNNQSPEDIVQDVVDNFTDNLTYTSTDVSGQTIVKYIANGYLIDVIDDMMKILDWQIRIDASDGFFFEPKGAIDNSKVFTTGINFQIEDWSQDATQQFNKVQVKGAIINHQTQESFVGDGVQTAFVLGNKPVGIVKVLVNGVEQVPDALGQGPYDVDAETKTINFVTPPPNTHVVLIDYSFSLPVVVEFQDDASIIQYGEIFRDVPAPFLDNFTDVRNYASNLIQVFANPLVKAIGFSADMNFTQQPGELVTVIDTERNKTELMVIRKIIYNAAENKTIYTFGTRDFVIIDWQKEVEDRIKELEKQVQDVDNIAIARLFAHNLSIVNTTTFPNKMNSPKTSFMLGHETLGLLRASADEEADAESTGVIHNGTWQGTGIGGSQYTFLDPFANLVSYWAMDEREGTTTADSKGANTATFVGAPAWVDGKFGSALHFDGSADYLDLGDDTDFEFGAGDFSIEAWINLDTLPSAGATMTIASKMDIAGTQSEWAFVVHATGDFLGLVTSTDGTALLTRRGTTTALTTGTWKHVVVTKTGSTAEFYIDGVKEAAGVGTVGGTLFTGTADMNIGALDDPTLFFDGKIDNVRVYDALLTDEQVKTLYNLARASIGKDELRLSYGSFNGTDNYVTTPDEAELDITADISIVIGVKVAALPGAEKWLMQKYDGTDGYAVRINASNEVELFYSSGGTTTTLATGTVLTVDEFQHVAFTKTGTTLKSYIDGVATNTGTGNTSAIGSNASALEVGRRTATFFTGDLDELRIYNDELSAGEVLNIYNKITHTGNQILYWAFDNPLLGDTTTQKREIPNP